MAVDGMTDDHGFSILMKAVPMNWEAASIVRLYMKSTQIFDRNSHSVLSIAHGIFSYSSVASGSMF